ncbi:diacylglycerol/lipid kinase family protein [Calidifontibacter terrae]
MTELSGRATVLVNPAAGGGSASSRADTVVAILRSLGFDPTCVATQSAEHATELGAAAGPTDLLLPLGGDGMIARVAEGCVHSGALLTPLPAGRGNDFVRGLGLPRDTLAVTRALSTATEHRVDVGTVDDRIFIGTLTVGFNAVANERANAIRRFRGAVVYTAAGIRTALTMKPISFRITSEGPDGHRQLETDGWSLNIGNSGRHGGGLTATPGADLSDGLLEVVITRGRSFVGLAGSALLERGGNHVRLPMVDSWQATSLTVDARSYGSRPMPVYADGDPIATLPVTIGISPLALRLYY